MGDRYGTRPEFYYRPRAPEVDGLDQGIRQIAGAGKQRSRRAQGLHRLLEEQTIRGRNVLDGWLRRMRCAPLIVKIRETEWPLFHRLPTQTSARLFRRSSPSPAAPAARPGISKPLHGPSPAPRATQQSDR